MARKKIDVNGVLPATRRITRSQAHAPGASPLTEKLPTPKRRPRKTEKKRRTSSTKKQSVDEHGNVNGQDSGYSFGDTENQTTDTENTEITEAEQTDLERTDTDADLTDADQTFTGLERIDEYPQSSLTEAKQIVNGTTNSSLTRPTNGEHGSYVYKTERLRTKFDFVQRRTDDKNNSGSVATGIAVETTIAAKTTAITERETQLDTSLIDREATPKPLRQSDQSSLRRRGGGASSGVLLRDSGKEAYDHTTPGRKAIYPPINSVLGKHINDEEDSASQRSIKRTKMSRPENAKASSLTPHLDPNIRSLAFSFGSEELNQLRMLTPSRRQRAVTQTLANNDKENDNPEDKEKSFHRDAAVEESDNHGNNGNVDNKSMHRTSADSKVVEKGVELYTKSPVATGFHDRQLVKTPNTSKGWGFRSLWGSVSRLLPGAQTEPKITLDREDVQMSNNADPVSPTPFRANGVQSSSEQSSQNPKKAAVSSKPHIALKGRTHGSKPREKDADKRFAKHKAAWQIREDNRRMKNEAKARRIREAEEREQKRKTKIKVHIDELPEIPTHRPGESGAYGMLDEFFIYDSDSDNEVVELDETQYDLEDVSAGSKKPSKRVKTSQGADSGSSEVPQFAPMPGNIEDPFTGFSQSNTESHRAKPYLGTLFADKVDATTYKGGNVFGQSEKFSGTPGDSSSRDRISLSPKKVRTGANGKNVEFTKLPPSTITQFDHFNKPNSIEQSGIFCVPDDSDSDDSFSEDEDAGLRLGSKHKSSTEGKSGHNTAGADAKRNMAVSEKLKSETTPSSSKANIFEVGMNSSKTSSLTQKQSAQGRDTGSYENSVADPAGDDTQLHLFTQPPPPRPVPAHATLPSTTSSIADSDALARARSQAEKYKPKQPSGLRASSKLSSPAGLMDARKETEHGTPLVPTSDSIDSNGGIPAGSKDQLTSINDVALTSQPGSSLQETNLPSDSNNQDLGTHPTSPIVFDFPPAIPVDPAMADMLQAGQKEASYQYHGADFDVKAIDDFEARLNAYLEQGPRVGGLLGA